MYGSDGIPPYRFASGFYAMRSEFSEIDDDECDGYGIEYEGEDGCDMVYDVVIIFFDDLWNESKDDSCSDTKG